MTETGRESQLLAAVDRAAAVGQLAGWLREGRGLPVSEAHLSAHLIVAHGWGEDATVALAATDRCARHEALAHDGARHH